MNPFDQALEDSTPETTTDSPPSNENEGDSTDPGDSSGGDDGGSGEGPDAGGGEPPAPEPPDTIAPEPVYNFLLIGQFGESPGSIARAAFNGSDFVLEDGSSYGFFPGAFHTLFSFGPDSLIVIEDANGDGRNDLLVAREVPSVGTSIELLEQDSDDQFRVVAATALYLQRVQGLALFDIEGDGVRELLLSLSGKKRLYVYERVGTSWDYSREFVLPVEPGLLIVSQEGATGPGKLLHIIDSNLQVVLNAREASPVAFSFGLGTPLQRMRSVSVDFFGNGDAASEVRVIEMADRLILFDLPDGQPVAFASLARESDVPLLLIGDYSGRGVREVIWLP